MCVNKQDKSRFKTLEHWPLFSNLGCFLISFKFVLKKFKKKCCKLLKITHHGSM